MFDKFHIAKHLSEAVDLVRRRENKQLKAAGDDRLSGTRYNWLRHPARMEPEDRKQFAALRDSNLKPRGSGRSRKPRWPSLSIAISVLPRSTARLHRTSAAKHALVNHPLFIVLLRNQRTHRIHIKSGVHNNGSRAFT